MLAIARASFRSILRSPSAVVFTLLFPLIFILVFGFINGGGLSLDVALDGRSDTRNPVFDSIVSLQGMHLIPGIAAADLPLRLQKGDIDAIVNIQKRLSDNTVSYTLEVTTSKAAREKGVIIRSMLEHLADKANLNAAHAENELVMLTAKEVNVREYKTIDFILPG